MSRIDWYLQKSAGAAGDLGAAANRFSEHMRGTGKANMPRTYLGHKMLPEPLGRIHSNGNVSYDHVLATNPRAQRGMETFNPKNRAQALGGNLADAADRIISAPRKMLNNANFGRNPFSGL